jgi:RNase P/RNase MRP subunit p29
MVTSTTRLGLEKPDYADAADIAVLNQNFDDIDNAVGMRVVTSTTRPATPWNGQIIFETDTNFTLVWNSTGSTWKQIGNAAIVCTSSTRPASPLNGQLIYETDTRNLLVYNTSGAAWRMPIQYFRPANAAGLAALTGMVSGDKAYQIDTNVEYLYNGSSWVQSYPPVPLSGSILQVVQTVKTDTYNQATAAWTDVTGFSLSITPTRATSKILLFVSGSCGFTLPGTSSAKAAFRITGGNTASYAGSSPSNRTASPVNWVSSASFAPADSSMPLDMKYLDSPATTSAITYKIQAYYNCPGGGSLYVNRSYNDADTIFYNRGVSTIIAMEVAG